MIITFFGHSSFKRTEKAEGLLLEYLERKISAKPVCLWLGGYGGFDDFAYGCCKKYKEKHPYASLALITPYITVDYQKNHLNTLKGMYDEIIYPELEEKPLRYAIYYRNRYMIEKADILISYITHSYGGAYGAYRYATKLKKEIFNLGNLI